MNGFIRTVAAMTDADLCELGGELGRTYVENEPSGELLGVVLVEQARRFARTVRATAEAQRSQRDAGKENGEGFL